MAPVIWGLDLKEIQWGKFKSSYMWNTEYHLRRTKFIVYQCALIFPVISESLGTAVLSDYVKSQKYVQRQIPGSYVFNNDYIGAASYNIWAGVFTAFVFGAAFFFDLIWPERKENRGVRIAWKVCGVLSCIFLLSSALTLTIITAKNCVYFRGVSEARGAAVLAQFHKDGGTPVCYRHDGRAIAATVFIWPGWLSACYSCVLLFMSIDHTEKGPGPKSTHARRRDAPGVEAQAVHEMERGNEKPSEESGNEGTPSFSAPAPPAAVHHNGSETAPPGFATPAEYPQTLQR